jgi:cytochrome c oxidase subunit 2
MNLFAATSLAHSVDSLAMALTAVTAALVGLVFFLLLYFGIKYRKGSKASRAGRASSSWTVEIANFVTMLVIGLVFFFWSSKIFYQQISPPPGSIELNVIGKQWMWIFQYPGGPKQIGRIKVPVNRPVRIILSSEDVIHSFFVPEFRLKQDAVPGRYTSLWFQADKIGSYDVLCSEFCGTSHSAMRGILEVVSKEEFNAYRAGAEMARPDGAKAYQRLACATCHETGQRLAPSLRGLFGKKVALSDGRTVLADENYYRRAIFLPAQELVRGYGPLMPTYRGQLSEAELSALIQYLKTLPVKHP